MSKSDRDIHAYDNAMKRIRHHRKFEISRRQMLKGSAAALGATLAAQFVPKEVHAEVSGTIVHFASSGKRLSNSLRAVKPLFDKVFPNVELEVVSKPMTEALTQINTYMRSKSDAFDVVTQDHAQFASLDAMGALTNLDPYLERDSAWYEDYQGDVPENYRHMWNLPKGPAPPGWVAAVAPDGNAMMTFYRKDVFDKLGIKVPTTWDDVIEVAKEIHDPKNERYAYAAAMARNFWSGYQFYGALRSWGGDFFVDERNQDWTPACSTEEGFQSLSTLVELQKYAHPVTANAGEDEVNQVFANGTALFSPLSWGTATLNDPTYSDYHEHWHMELSPKGTTPKSAHRALAGGFGQFMPTWGGNRETAWAWIKFLNSGDREDLGGSPLIADAIVGAGGQLSRVSTLTRWADRKPFFVGLMKAYPVSVVNAPVIPEAYAIMGAVGEEVADAVNDDQSVEDALKACDKRIQRLMEDAGYYS
ncbi:MAG: extracellular solute-binding protein [Rhodospirillales bacterium]|nr:extracellular solute-binding protein [Rhodospirillales bacterium]MDP6841647.1 extracellular solute-binding protein [Rhodospirillales bacterium]